MKKITKIISLSIIIIIVLFLIAYRETSLTSEVALDIKEKYKLGETIKGSLKIKISEGELIPTDSKVIINFSNQEKEFTLSELTNSKTINGKFYAQDTSISGEGEGYGNLGFITTYPEINFELLIYSPNKKESKEDRSNEENSEEEEEESEDSNKESDEESEDEGNEEESEDSENNMKTSTVKEEESDEESEDEGNEEESEEPEETSEPKPEPEPDPSPITGASISDLKTTSASTISGTVSKNKKFTYKKEKSQTAEIVSGSINVNGQEIEESNLKLKLQEREITVTTKYSVKQEGFGEEYLGKKKKQLSINLKKFNLIAKNNSILNIKLAYENEIIVEAEKAITIEEESETNETEINNTETNQTIINNTTTNQTISNQTTSNKTIKINDILVNLSQEKAVLKKPVRWVRKINISDEAHLVVELPASATNISFNKILKSGNLTATLFISGRAISEHPHKKNIRIDINGKVTAEIEDEQPKIIKWFKKLFGITGHVISEEETNTKEILIETDGTEKSIEVMYQTPAPYSIEANQSNGKITKIIGPTGIHYNDVHVFTNLPENLNISNPNLINIHWIENNRSIPPLNTTDLNNNSIYDYIEWIVPRLSNQTFNISIDPSQQDTPNQNGESSNSVSGRELGTSSNSGDKTSENPSNPPLLTNTTIKEEDPITIAQAREHDIGHNTQIKAPKNALLIAGLIIGLLIIIIIINLIISKKSKEKKQKNLIEIEHKKQIKQEKQILKNTKKLNKILKKHEINIKKSTEKYKKQLEKARKKEIKNKRYLPYIQSTTIKAKLKKPFIALGSLFTKSKHTHKKGVVLIDGKIIGILKEKTKDKNLKGKYIKINKTN